ncbi:MAG: GAF domain-containing sensor histidine kinase [Balneolaceae bacterium]|nr:GAF domain-containing sensor histidine kinase [Balneolaceae bacterium]
MDDILEFKRLEALNSYKVLHTGAEEEYDELTRLAASICASPVAIINLLDDREQWSKSLYGISSDQRSTPRKSTVCQYAIQKIDLFEVPDLSVDERFKDLSHVKNDPKFRYYLGAPLENNDGLIIGTLCILDFTPKRLDAEKKNQLRILANQVMAHLELRKQNAELKRLNQYHVQLMKMLSHDLRAPLNGIIGLTDLMIETEDFVISGAESKSLIKGISQSAKQLKQMISEIFNYALLDSEGFKIDSQKADLRETIQKMKSLYEPLARFKNIDLQFTGSNNLANVQIDKEKFEQIFGNLLSNAIKYTENGGSVQSTLERIPEYGSTSIILRVKDTGTGMTEEVREMLLKGLSVKSNQKPDVDSTGIGMTIIKRFVDLFNGKLEITSSPGAGSEFTITLPVHS